MESPNTGAASIAPPATTPHNPNQLMEVLPPPSTSYVLAAEERSLNFLNPKLWQAMQVAARAFYEAGALPKSIDNVGKVIMVLQAGYEAGMQPLEALSSFYFVNGKLALFGEMAINMVIRRGHKVKWGECNEKTATVTITRGDDESNSMTNTFTMEQAKARKLDTGSQGVKDPWLKHPENMLKFKVFHMTAKFVCPDAFHGLPIKEVLESDVLDVVEAGNQAGSPKAAISALETGRKTLEAALSEPEAEIGAPDPKKRGKKAKDEVADLETEPVVTGPKAGAVNVSDIAETDEMKAARLTEAELEGALEGADRMWLSRYQARSHK